MYAAQQPDQYAEQPGENSQQLSSGSKINSGADDAAGLSLVNGLQANCNRPVAVADQRPGRRRPSASRRWRSLASDEPAQPCRYAGYRGLERHPQRFAADGGQPGIPVDSFRNQQHRLDHDLQPEAGLRIADRHLHRRFFDARRFHQPAEYPFVVFGQRRRTNGTMSYSNGQTMCSSTCRRRGNNAGLSDSLGAARVDDHDRCQLHDQGRQRLGIEASANVSAGAGTQYCQHGAKA